MKILCTLKFGLCTRRFVTTIHDSFDTRTISQFYMNLLGILEDNYVDMKQKRG